MQPCHRLRSFGIIFDRQAVAAELLVIGELTVQKQRAVGHMEPVFVYRQVRCIGFQSECFQKAGCPFRETAVEIGTEHFINLLADAFFIGNTSVLGEETSAHAHHGILLQKVLTESNLV